MHITDAIRERLFALSDPAYGDFQSRLMPGIDRSRIIGVRTPELRRLAKELCGTDGINAFLDDLPHASYDEYNLHGFIISEIKDYPEAAARVNALLPYVDNWATCDLLSPKAFFKHRDLLEADVLRWLASDHPFTIRFGLEMIQTHFLDKDFNVKWLDRAAAVRSGEYYVNMMQAWFFATALTKQWDSALPYIGQHRLDVWAHNKAIQKAAESRCISDERKAYLKTLKRKE